MLQTLFYIPNQVFGIPFLRTESGYGFGLALAFVLLVGGVMLWNKYRLQGTEGDFFGSLGVLAVVCLAVAFVVPKLADERGLPIRGYGTMLLIAVVSGVALGMWRAKQAGANPEIILSMMFLIFIGGLIGARTLFVWEYWNQFTPDAQITVRTPDGEFELLLDSDTAVIFNGEKSHIANFKPDQTVWITRRDRKDEPYARRVKDENYARRVSDEAPLPELKNHQDVFKATMVATAAPTWAAIGKSVVKIIDVTKGGLVVYGSFLGAIVPFVWYVWRFRLPILPLCDIVVASLLLGQALGRVGCLFNGCCYGSVCELENLPRVAFPFQSPPYFRQVETGKLFLAGLALKKTPLDFVEISSLEPSSPAAASGLRAGMRVAEIVLSDVPSAAGPVLTETMIDPTLDEANRLLYRAENRRLDLHVMDGQGSKIVDWTVRRAAPAESLPAHPTQLYDAINAGIMSLFAWLYFPFRRRDGEVFALMLTIFPISRFLMEWVRSDEPAKFFYGTMTISQLISVGLFLSSFAFWWWVLRQKRDEKLTPSDWAPRNLYWAEATA